MLSLKMKGWRKIFHAIDNFFQQPEKLCRFKQISGQNSEFSLSFNVPIQISKCQVNDFQNYLRRRKLCVFVCLWQAHHVSRSARMQQIFLCAHACAVTGGSFLVQNFKYHFWNNVFLQAGFTLCTDEALLIMSKIYWHFF